MEVNTTAYSKPSNQRLKDTIPLLAIAALPALFLPTFSSLTYKWMQWTEGLSHGFLLMAMFVYLAYKALPLSAAKASTAQRLLTGLALLGLSCAWAMFALININLLAELAVLGCLTLFIAHVYGLGTAWQHRFLLLLPIFAITLWDHLNTPLVNLSGFMVGEMVRAINIPAVIDGSSIFIPFGHIVIADGCSGLRYFIIAQAMGYLIAYLNGYSEKGYVATLLVAALLALISNWLRIFILILVGYFTEMESSLMKEHDTFGWLLFACICFPALYFAPVNKSPKPIVTTPTTRPTMAAALLGFFLLSAGPAIYWLSAAPSSEQQTAKEISSSPFNAMINPNDQLHVIISADEFPKEIQIYAHLGESYLTINQSLRTKKGQKLVPFLGDLFDKGRWTLEPSNMVDTEKTLNLPVLGSASVLRAKGSQLRVAQLQWFNIGSFSSSSPTRAKLLQIPAILSGQNNFQMVTLRQTCTTTNCMQALANLAAQANLLYQNMKDH